jgi:hypothetical protein
MNPYKILGITDSATLDEIKAAYRERARRYHPDAGGDSWAFQQVNEAYEELLRQHCDPVEADARQAQTDPRPSGDQGPARALLPSNPFFWSAMKLTAIAVCVVVEYWYWDVLWRFNVLALAVAIAVFGYFSHRHSRNIEKEEFVSANIFGLGGMLCWLFAFWLFCVGISSTSTPLPKPPLRSESTVPLSISESPSTAGLPRTANRTEGDPLSQMYDQVRQKQRERYYLWTSDGLNFYAIKFWASIIFIIVVVSRGVYGALEAHRRRG